MFKWRQPDKLDGYYNRKTELYAGIYKPNMQNHFPIQILWETLIFSSGSTLFRILLRISLNHGNTSVRDELLDLVF